MAFTFVKKVGAPSGSITIEVGNKTFTIDDSANPTISVPDAATAGDLQRSPYLQFQGGSRPFTPIISVAPVVAEVDNPQQGDTLSYDVGKGLWVSGPNVGGSQISYGTLAQRNALNLASLPDGFSFFATDDSGGTLYQVQTGAWAMVAPKGVELGYVEKTDGDFSTASTAFIDVSGVTVTVTARGRPLKIRAGGQAMKVDTVGVAASTRLVEGATQIAQSSAFSNIANSLAPFSLEARRNPSAGTVLTYKLQAACVFGDGSTKHAILPNGADHPLWLEVVER